MLRRTLNLCVLPLVVLVPGVCAGQTAAPESGAPHLVRAAGMPLNDGALPPGMLTVRIVQGAFTSNLADRVVEVAVEGGKVDSARTGADGRAQFAHLPIGARVRTSATVDGARLESEPFEMPAQSGVRVLLVASDGTALLPVSSPAPTAAPPPVVPRPADTGVAVIRAVLATSTVLAFGGLFLYRRFGST